MVGSGTWLAGKSSEQACCSPWMAALAGEEVSMGLWVQCRINTAALWVVLQWAWLAALHIPLSLSSLCLLGWLGCWDPS